MGYQLGIDFGTTYTAAAVRRTDRAEPEVVSLGGRTVPVASVVFVAEDGSILVGEAAERRALTDPDRVVREFKRRIGDGIPMMVGGWSVTAQDLAARVVRWVSDRVAEREGGPASAIAVTHPAGWGPHKRELFADALRNVGLADVALMAEPQAAASGYASAQRVEPGSVVAVYDLGGGTFDAAVVRKTAEGDFELLGRADGIEDLGGADFDEAIFEHVRAVAGSQLDGVDVADPVVLAALGRLRRECTEAKEALSADTEVTIPVMVPGATTQVRMVRGEFEEMIRPAVEDTIEVLRRTVASAGLNTTDLSAVLLVGGSSRIPLVAELVSGRLARPVAVDTDPNTIVALGAAVACGLGADGSAVPDGSGETPAAAMDALMQTAHHVDERPDTPWQDEGPRLPWERDEAERENPYHFPDRPMRDPAPLAVEENTGRKRRRAVVLSSACAAVIAAAVIVMGMRPGGFLDNTVDAGSPASPNANPGASGPPQHKRPTPSNGSKSPGRNTSQPVDPDAGNPQVPGPSETDHRNPPEETSPPDDGDPGADDSPSPGGPTNSPPPNTITPEPDPKDTASATARAATHSR